MSDSFEILPHTADVRLKVIGETLEKLFEQAVLGMMQILSSTKFEIKNQKSKIKIKLKSKNATMLLIDFLNEVLTNSYINKCIYQLSAIRFQSSDKEINLEAELVGVKIDGFDKDIKAVTYHGAEIIKNKENNFEIVITFDI